jgi:hypothetical protein
MCLLAIGDVMTEIPDCLPMGFEQWQIHAPSFHIESPLYLYHAALMTHLTSGRPNLTPTTASSIPPISAASRLGGSFSSSYSFSQRQQSFLMQQDKKRSISVYPSSTATSPTSGVAVSPAGHEDLLTVVSRLDLNSHQQRHNEDEDEILDHRPFMLTRETCRCLLNIVQFILEYPDEFPSGEVGSAGSKDLSLLKDYFGVKTGVTGLNSVEVHSLEKWGLNKPVMVRTNDCSTTDAFLRWMAERVLFRLHQRTLMSQYFDIVPGTRVLISRRLDRIAKVRPVSALSDVGTTKSVVSESSTTEAAR